VVGFDVDVAAMPMAATPAAIQIQGLRQLNDTFG